jgi:hypothetical protein
MLIMHRKLTRSTMCIIKKNRKHHVSGGRLRHPHKSNRVDPRVALSRQFQADKSLIGRVQFNFKNWVKNHCIGPSLFPFCLSPLLSHFLPIPHHHLLLPPLRLVATITTSPKPAPLQMGQNMRTIITSS